MLSRDIIKKVRRLSSQLGYYGCESFSSKKKKKYVMPTNPDRKPKGRVVRLTFVYNSNGTIDTYPTK